VAGGASRFEPRPLLRGNCTLFRMKSRVSEAGPFGWHRLAENRPSAVSAFRGVGAPFGGFLRSSANGGFLGEGRGPAGRVTPKDFSLRGSGYPSRPPARAGVVRENQICFLGAFGGWRAVRQPPMSRFRAGRENTRHGEARD